MKRFGIAIALLLILGIPVSIWFFSREAAQVPVYRLQRGTFEDQVTTNGRVEPSVWASARAERSGLILSVPVTKGQKVSKGTPLAILDSREAQADLASAQAQIEEARAKIQLLESGGSKREILEIDEGLKQHRTEIAQLEKDLAITERLVSKKAATEEEVRRLRDRIDLVRLQASALEAKRPALVASADIVSARARLKEAMAAADLAQRRIDLSTVRSPRDGVVYQLDAKPGVYLNPGDLVANVGEVGLLNVIVYVDEPELGRIRKEMPVRITWDAIEGKSWTGTISRIPTQIVPLGTRQVGELECRVENRDGDLLPGTNVNAFIQTRKLESVLLVPKEGIRTREGSTGVFVVENGVLSWRKVETGPSNVTHAVVQSGLKEGELVALGPESALKPGATVTTTTP